MKKIENWLETNTFHHGEFWDLLKLVELKENRDYRFHCVFLH